MIWNWRICLIGFLLGAAAGVQAFQPPPAQTPSPAEVREEVLEELDRLRDEAKKAKKEAEKARATDAGA